MDKKQSALIRIIAWSVVAVVLAGILVLGLTGNVGSGIGGFSNIWDQSGGSLRRCRQI